VTLRIAVDLFGKAGCRCSAAFHRIALAQACFECGNKKDAQRYLSAAAKGNWMNSWMTTYQGVAAQAYFALKSGERKKAHSLLRKSFGIALRYSLKMLPLWNRAAAATLCAEALGAGIETDFVCKLVQKYRLVPSEDIPAGETWPYPVKIYTFGRFEIERDGKPLEFSGKIQKKPLELLKALIAFGSSGVPEERIIDALWPETQGDSAAYSFDWTLKRLKKLLGEKIVRTQDGKIYLDEKRCWSDASAFESVAARTETIHARGKRPLSADEARLHERLMSRMLAVYRGEFLADEP
jgi:hypothetical protein